MNFEFAILLAVTIAFANGLTNGPTNSYILSPGKGLPGPIRSDSLKITRNVTLNECAAACSLEYLLQQFHCYAFEYNSVSKDCLITNITTLSLREGYLGLVNNNDMAYYERSKGSYLHLFQPYMNKVLEQPKMYFAEFPNKTLEQCAMFCLVESRETCMSFSFNEHARMCKLGKVYAIDKGPKMIDSQDYNHYQYYSTWPCNATIPWQYSPRAIASPYFPYASVSNVNCQLNIEAPEGQQIDLTFSTFFTQSSICQGQSDGIVIFDGDSANADVLFKLCTSENFSHRRYISSTGSLRIKFTTGSASMAFKAVYDFKTVDPCVNSPCKHNGTCVPHSGQFTCACVLGYTGALCETDVNECASAPCYMGGTCNDLVNGFRCDCPKMLGGRICDKFVGLCYLNPCENGGLCTPRGMDDYICQCPWGYSGRTCNHRVPDPCYSHPCLNGSHCTSHMDGSYTCTCAIGITGLRCETNVDDCHSRPCFHDFPCIDLLNDYRCECPSFLSGKNCDEFIGKCHEKPCKHGTCVPTGRDNYTCECEPSYTGRTCDSLFINFCQPNPCKHGTCTSFSNGPSCKCDSGFDGFMCDKKAVVCDNVICEHGECVGKKEDFECKCVTGYKGRFCNETIDHCQAINCSNGYCINTITSYYCVCNNGTIAMNCGEVKPCDKSNCEHGTCMQQHGSQICECLNGFTGNECDVQIDYCDLKPCQHGTCSSIHGGFNCTCDDNFTGVLCNTTIDPCKNNQCVFGVCVDQLDSYSCLCAKGYHGNLCQYKLNETEPLTTSSMHLTAVHLTTQATEIDPCILVSCQNGGKCNITSSTNDSSNYGCVCSSAYHGDRCEFNYLCDKQPCEIGVCVPAGNYFRCITEPLIGASNVSSVGSPFWLEPTTSTSLSPVLERSDITCKSESISIYLPANLLPNIQNITWREDKCKVAFNGSHYISSILLSECGTTVLIENDTVTFLNDLIIRNSSTYNQTHIGYITYGENYQTVIPVKCVYPRHNHVATSYTPINANVRFFEKRYGQLEIVMEQYETAAFDKAVLATSYPRRIPLNNDVFVRLALNIKPSNIRIKVDSCIATSMPSLVDSNWHQLIQSGCPTNSVHLLSNDNSSDVKFAFKAFDFSQGSTGFVYIHCEVGICDARDHSCRMGCPGRTRRAVSSGNTGFYIVSTGPLLVEKKNSDDIGFVAVPVVLAAVCLLIAVVAVIGAVSIWWSNKRHYSLLLQ